MIWTIWPKGGGYSTSREIKTRVCSTDDSRFLLAQRNNRIGERSQLANVNETVKTVLIRRTRKRECEAAHRESIILPVWIWRPLTRIKLLTDFEGEEERKKKTKRELGADDWSQIDFLGHNACAMSMSSRVTKTSWSACFTIDMRATPRAHKSLVGVHTRVNYPLGLWTRRFCDAFYIGWVENRSRLLEVARR